MKKKQFQQDFLFVFVFLTRNALFCVEFQKTQSHVKKLKG